MSEKPTADLIEQQRLLLEARQAARKQIKAEDDARKLREAKANAELAQHLTEQATADRQRKMPSRAARTAHNQSPLDGVIEMSLTESAEYDRVLAERRAAYSPGDFACMDSSAERAEVARRVLAQRMHLAGMSADRILVTCAYTRSELKRLIETGFKETDGPDVDALFGMNPCSETKLLGTLCRFHWSFVASPSRRRGLGKRTAFE